METDVLKLERQLTDLKALMPELVGDEQALHAAMVRKEQIEEQLRGTVQKMDYRQELLTILMEECGEVIQAASKCIRFGCDNKNLKSLEKEMGDLYCMIDLLHEYDMVSLTELDDRAKVKREKLKLYSSLLDES